MNQLNQKSLSLSADEARNLHSDLFDLLNRLGANNDTNSISLDGGKF